MKKWLVALCCFAAGCGSSRPATTDGDSGGEGGSGAAMSSGAAAAAADTSGEGGMDTGAPGADTGVAGTDTGVAGADTGAAGADTGAYAGAGMGGAGGEPDGDLTSGQLIDAAVRAGTLSAEQSLVYRVYAAFNDPRLPAEFRGLALETVDDPILMTVGRLFPTLSAGTQALLEPFLVPPIYSNSWYAARFPAAELSKSGGSQRIAQARELEPSCGHLIADPSGLTQVKTTAHTRIHYCAACGAIEEATANTVASNVEAIWTKVTGTFGRSPPSDASLVGCNGGDGALDIIVVPYNVWQAPSGAVAPSALAFAVASTRACSETPSFILIKSGEGETKTRNALAHEFFHTLELGAYTFGAACDRYYWLSEATANWTMDLVFPNDQYEQTWAAGNMYVERKVSLDVGYDDDAHKTNGYGDYVFLQYLARKYGDATIKAAWDATSLFDGIGAVSAAIESRGDYERVWPEFALASWNDFQAGKHDELHTWDQLEWGLKKTFDVRDAGGQFGDPSTKIELDGASRKTFDLLQSLDDFPINDDLQGLSFHADYLKFTDEAVSSVTFTNFLAFGSFPKLKIQALVKVGGQWKAPSDWTKSTFKTFCRDQKDERIEELVLIYSNSDDAQPAQPILFSGTPKLSVSNVGCWRWEGTSSITDVGADVDQSSTATGLVFARHVAPELPDGTPGFETFEPVAGQVTSTSTLLIGGGACTAFLDAAGAVSSLDGWLELNTDIDLGFEPPDRLVRLGDNASQLSTTTRMVCPESDERNTNPSPWTWLQIRAFTDAVSADGTTLEGSYSETSPAYTRTSTWSFKAVREQ